MGIVKCTICGEWVREDDHKCMPKWDMVVPSKGDDPELPERVCYAADAKSAALKLVEEKFSDWEYPDNIEIWVRPFGDIDQWEKYEVEVEVVPSFEATKIEGE